MALAVIPARLASTRLPNKVLLKQTGQYLIQHVWERVRKARSIDRIIVAADHPSVASACREFGADCMMTSAAHSSGTQRTAEVVRRVRSASRIVNVQGDEPDLDPAAIDRLVRALNGAELATLAAPFADARDASNPNRVKVVLDRRGDAIFFSRSLIPYPREAVAHPLLHLGLYAFRRSALLRWTSLPPTPLERTEKLEQLRALEHGMSIRVIVLKSPWPGGIDTLEDYRAFCRRNALNVRPASLQ